MLKKMIVIAFLAVSAFANHTAELNLNEKDLEVAGRIDMGQFNMAVEPNTTFVGGKFLKAHEDHSSNNRVSLDPYYELNFLMMRDISNSGMRVGMGVKLNYTNKYSTLPLGLEMEYKIPSARVIPIYLNGEFYYAPQVLSFHDAKDFLEYRASIDIELIKNGRITLGYRNLDTDYDRLSGSFNYNESWYFGFKIGF